ncbi:MAG: hypothetical protein AB1644_08680 [Candidatus Zixiibacteriota bacterium]
MAHRSRLALILLATGAILLPTLGCTLIGLGLGAIADSGKPKKKPVPGWEWQTLKRNEKVTIFRTDGSQDSGRFVTVSEADAAAYADRFAREHDTDPSAARLPRPGDTLSIATHNGDSMRCTLIGYDRRYRPVDPYQKRDTLESMTTDGTLTCLLTVQNNESGAIQRIDSRNIDAVVVKDDFVLSGADITSAVQNHHVPLLSSLVILNDSIQLVIPVDQIEQVWVKNRVHGKTTGLIIGAIIDAAVIAAVIAFAASGGMDMSLTSSSSNGTWSCPFIYSFDGQKYHRQAEVFGGAIFRAAQRTDWVTLDSLRDVDGVCRIRITNELEETQYVDELKLLAVDHSPGTHVVPTFDGTLRVTAAPVAPIQAYDDRGANLSEMLRETDDRTWVSNPFGRDPADINQVRDGLVLEFSLPPGVDSATLILNGQNSAWSAEMLGHILSLQGDSLESWYRSLNNSEPDRSRLMQAMIREGMLLVKVWDQGTWRHAGTIWEIGPAVPRDVAVVLRLPHSSDSLLRVRLESTAGFWMINRAAVEYGWSSPVRVTELAAARALDYRSEDQRRRLANLDQNYYAMPSTLDWADVEFEVPPRVERLTRSYVVKCSGYYTIHVCGEGEPQDKLIAQLLDEPGAFGRYSLQLLNQYVLTSLEVVDTAETR